MEMCILLTMSSTPCATKLLARSVLQLGRPQLGGGHGPAPPSTEDQAGGMREGVLRAQGGHFKGCLVAEVAVLPQC